MIDFNKDVQKILFFIFFKLHLHVCGMLIYEQKWRSFIPVECTILRFKYLNKFS